MGTRIEMETDINLGDRVRDRVSGLTGVVVAVCVWLYGCARVTIQPDGLHDGKRLDFDTFDELQLELVSKGKVPTDQRQVRSGGPRNDAAALSRD